MSDHRIEQRVQTIGRELFDLAQSVRGHSVGQWMDNLLMRFSMRDERVKTQLFRFIDVLPVLGTSEQINGHLRQYLLQADGDLSPVMRTGLHAVPEHGVIAQQVARLATNNA